MMTPRTADDYQRARLKGLADMARKGQTRPRAGCYLLGFMLLMLALMTSIASACGFGYFPPIQPRPVNYDALLAYMQEHYDPSVDCEACLDRFCKQADSLPELPFAEAITAFVVIARFESHGKPEVVSPTHDYGCLQINRCHRKPMANEGLDFRSEDDRVYWGFRMVGEQLANGESWWQAFSPWTVMRSHGKTIKTDYAALLAGAE